MRKKVVALLPLLSMLTAGLLAGQQTHVDVSPFGSRILPDVQPTLGAKALRKDLTFFVSPFFLDTDGLQIGSITGGFSYSGFAKPLSLSANYSYIDPTGADKLDSYGITLKSNFLKRNTWGLTALGTYSDTEGSNQIKAGISSELKPGGAEAAFSLGADLLWTKKDTATGEVDGLIPVGKLMYGFPKRGDYAFAVGADYTFDSGEDFDDDYSLEINLTIRDLTTLALGGGKGNTFYLYAVQLF